jgi:hypothetical protein
MAVGLIAYRQLDRVQQKKVQAILMQHPHYKEFLSANRPSDAPVEEWVVMQAAVWPDWVRENHKSEGFSKPTHHYVNLPIKRLDGASEVEVKQIEKNIAELPKKPASGQILEELPRRLKDVRAGTTEAKDRAIAICWVLHMVGDLHQPLHAAALFTKDAPAGDEGGNVAYIPWRGRAEKLHFLWDGVVGWDEFSSPMLSAYGMVDLMVREFQRRHKVTDEERAVKKVNDWAAESRDLADKEAYSFKGTALPITFHFNSHMHLKAADLKPLPPGYAERARQIAEKRVALAGLRLADQLKDGLPEDR